MLHEIRVNGYAAEADGPLDLGTWGSYGTEQLHFTFDAAWDDLTKSVTFSTDGYTGEAVTLLLPESGRVEVPQQATAAQTVCGRITVLGTCAGVQRISADLPYQTRNHSAVPGQAPHSLPSAFEEISTAAERACSRAQNAEDAAALAQTSAQVAQAAAQDAVRVAASAQKIARSVRDDADAGAFQGEKLTYADLTEQDKADLRRPALEAAATANEAVAGLGQTLLRYGVQVGQIGEIVLFGRYPAPQSSVGRRFGNRSRRLPGAGRLCRPGRLGKKQYQRPLLPAGPASALPADEQHPGGHHRRRGFAHADPGRTSQPQSYVHAPGGLVRQRRPGHSHQLRQRKQSLRGQKHPQPHRLQRQRAGPQQDPPITPWRRRSVLAGMFSCWNCWAANKLEKEECA